MYPVLFVVVHYVLKWGATDAVVMDTGSNDNQDIHIHVGKVGRSIARATMKKKPSLKGGSVEGGEEGKEEDDVGGEAAPTAPSAPATKGGDKNSKGGPASAPTKQVGAVSTSSTQRVMV
jgi:hypothetical protein